jgi:Zn-finger nucleic acid-binding protein
MAGDNLDHFCPRDGSLLIPPEDSDLGAYLRYGAYHCDTCAGMLLNSKAAESAFCVDKLNHMHEGFTEEGTEVDLDCPFCDSHMRVRKFSFQKIDGSLTEPIEIDGCPICASFWLDAGELHKLSPPVNGEGRTPRIEANALAVVLEVLLQLPIILL